ncbi:MAG: molybdopterin dinucleotide binding domain-containing protein, partial [Limisphaerales bacterium]
MPHFSIVERDYVNLVHRFNSLGPGIKEHGVEDHGIDMHVADLYDEFAKIVPAYEWNGRSYPSLVEPVNAAEAVLFFAPESNGEVAWRGFKERERQTGRPLADLAEKYRSIRYSFDDLRKQPRRILTSPCWSGIVNDGRAYSGFVINVERLVPWRTLTGRQQLYQDHEAYRAFGESCPTFKPRISLENTFNIVNSKPAGKSITLACITPHGKWHIHSTYYDDLRMLTLSRGVEPFWLNEKDAAGIGIFDNDWVEAYNDNGVIVTRAVVSARIPRGICIFYHAPERTISFPKSKVRNNRRGGGTNSITRMRLKPVLMAGGYAHNC